MAASSGSLSSAFLYLKPTYTAETSVNLRLLLKSEALAAVAPAGTATSHQINAVTLLLVLHSLLLTMAVLLKHFTNRQFIFIKLLPQVNLKMF